MRFKIGDRVKVKSVFAKNDYCINGHSGEILSTRNFPTILIKLDVVICGGRRYIVESDKLTYDTNRNGANNE